MSYAARRSRNDARRHFEVPERVSLLEEDADEQDRQLAGLRNELKNTNKILSGLLVTIAAGTIVGALNLLIGRA